MQGPAPYPLRTTPLFQDYLWGGRKLQSELQKPIPAEGVWAESWEVIDHPQHQSIITNGPLAGKQLREVAQTYGTWLFGRHSAQLTALPLLFKYLDCQRVLSVQVHPNDEYAARMTPPDLGKTEAWYILQAEPGAKLYAGLKTGVRPEDLRQAVVAGRSEECLHELEPRVGDCLFIPAGTVHALGAGLLVAEIQQASNTTFRLYDWGRVGSDGQPRPLHIEQALDVIDFGSGPRQWQTPQPTSQPGRVRLVACEKFVLDRLGDRAESYLSINGQTSDAQGNCFHLLSAPRGGVQLEWTSAEDGTQQARLGVGQTTLLPAALSACQARVAPGCELLDMYLP